jgi:hypothetical protein
MLASHFHILPKLGVHGALLSLPNVFIALYLGMGELGACVFNPSLIPMDIPLFVVKGVAVTSCIEVMCCSTVHILCAGKSSRPQFGETNNCVLFFPVLVPLPVNHFLSSV